jgi:hypothetical protein
MGMLHTLKISLVSAESDAMASSSATVGRFCVAIGDTCTSIEWTLASADHEESSCAAALSSRSELSWKVATGSAGESEMECDEPGRKQASLHVHSQIRRIHSFDSETRASVPARRAMREPMPR